MDGIETGTISAPSEPSVSMAERQNSLIHYPYYARYKQKNHQLGLSNALSLLHLALLGYCFK
jgi:hypothetical protein